MFFLVTKEKSQSLEMVIKALGENVYVGDYIKLIRNL